MSSVNTFLVFSKVNDLNCQGFNVVNLFFSSHLFTEEAEGRMKEPHGACRCICTTVLNTAVSPVKVALAENTAALSYMSAESYSVSPLFIMHACTQFTVTHQQPLALRRLQSVIQVYRFNILS